MVKDITSLEELLESDFILLLTCLRLLTVEDNFESLDELISECLDFSNEPIGDDFRSDDDRELGSNLFFPSPDDDELLEGVSGLLFGFRLKSAPMFLSFLSLDSNLSGFVE